MKNMTVLEERVKILSSMNEKNEEEMDKLAEALVKSL